MDFTLKVYRKLLTTLLKGGYSFQTFEGFLAEPGERVVISRHDVGLRPLNALNMALLEKDMGVAGTYNFRTVPGSWDADVIKWVYQLGHEGTGWSRGFRGRSSCSGRLMI